LSDFWKRFVRPEDLYRYEGLVDVVKLAAAFPAP
jgi:hypothetical protein